MADLRGALDQLLATRPAAPLAAAVDDLMAAYHAPSPPSSVVLRGEREVAAYAAYRMPATYAAVRAALAQTAAALPGFAPRRVGDAGAGTGAASWAVADVFRAASFTLLEQSEPAIALGRSLASGSPSLRDADWRRWQAPGELPASDLLVCTYVLGELDDDGRESLVDAAAATAGAVLLVEPGTPAGYARVVAARRRLVAAGMRLVAPCPHEAECPLVPADDWCHFSARVERSPLHRRLKDARLGYEDEKFSFVAAVRGAVPSWPQARVLRHPRLRKGLVSLELCTGDGTAERRLVSKRTGDLYRAARKAGWGDRWPC